MTNSAHCPNCLTAMVQSTLERYDGGALAVDLCFRCHVIWFDAMESPQLAAGAVMELLQMIRREGSGQREILRDGLKCPRCAAPLLRTNDQVKSGRIHYFRCAREGGRLTPFLQFLIEKQFVRAVTPREIARLRLNIQQASCSSCGAPIDLMRQDHCEYCHAPITVLDADAVERAARVWSERAEQRAGARAAADKIIAQLRNVDQWNCSEGGDLLLRSIGIMDG